IGERHPIGVELIGRSSLSQVLEQDVARDREQERAEAGVAPEALAGGDAGHQRLLHEILDVVEARELVAEEAMQRTEVALEQQAPRFAITGAPLLEEGAVVHETDYSRTGRRSSATVRIPRLVGKHGPPTARVQPSWT